MPLSKISQIRLETCDERLQKVVEAVNEVFPLRVLCGHRDKAGQDAAIKAGTSKTPFPTSKHNKLPSLAVDLLPESLVSGSVINWGNKAAFKELAEVMFQTADKLGVHIRWGGDFNQDGSKTESDNWDMPHFEISSPKKQ